MRSSGTGVRFTQSLLAGHLVSVVCRRLHRFVRGSGLTARELSKIQLANCKIRKTFFRDFLVSQLDFCIPCGQFIISECGV